MQRAEARRLKEGKGKIPEKDIASGNIGPYLQPEDYKPLQNVSICFILAVSFRILVFRRTPGICRYSSDIV